MADKENKRITLDNWTLVVERPDPAYDKKLYLQGNVFNHPFHKDGQYIRTSEVVAYYMGIFMTESGNEYQLGSPNIQQRKKYSDPKKRAYTFTKRLLSDE